MQDSLFNLIDIGEAFVEYPVEKFEKKARKINFEFYKKLSIDKFIHQRAIVMYEENIRDIETDHTEIVNFLQQIIEKTAKNQESKYFTDHCSLILYTLFRFLKEVISANVFQKNISFFYQAYISSFKKECSVFSCDEKVNFFFVRAKFIHALMIFSPEFLIAEINSCQYPLILIEIINIILIFWNDKFNALAKTQELVTSLPIILERMKNNEFCDDVRNVILLLIDRIIKANKESPVFCKKEFLEFYFSNIEDAHYSETLLSWIDNVLPNEDFIDAACKFLNETKNVDLIISIMENIKKKNDPKEFIKIPICIFEKIKTMEVNEKTCDVFICAVSLSDIIQANLEKNSSAIPSAERAAVDHLTQLPQNLKRKIVKAIFNCDDNLDNPRYIAGKSNVFQIHLKIVEFFLPKQEFIDIVGKLCDYSDHNAIKLDNIKFNNEQLIEYLSEKKDKKEDSALLQKHLDLFIKISKVAASPRTVKLYLDLLKPIKVGVNAVNHVLFIQALYKLCYNYEDIPKKVFKLKNYNKSKELKPISVTINQDQLIKGFTFTCWENIHSKLELQFFTFKIDETPVLTAKINSTTIFLNDTDFKSDDRYIWSLFAITICESKVTNIYFKGKSIKTNIDLNIQMNPDSKITLEIGGEKERDGNIGIFTIYKQLDDKKIEMVENQGPTKRDVLKKYAYLFSYPDQPCIENYKAGKDKDYSDHSFLSVLLTNFNIDILLPLYVSVSFKCSDKTYDNLLPSYVTGIFSQLFHASDTAIKQFRATNSIKVIEHLLINADATAINQPLCSTFITMIQSLENNSDKNDFLSSILLNFEIWTKNRSDEHIAIIENITNIFIKDIVKVTSVKSLLSVLNVYYYYVREDGTKNDEALIKARKLVINLLLSLCKNSFTQEDYNDIINSLESIKDDLQKIDLIHLLGDIAKLPDKPLNNIKMLQTMHGLYSILLSGDDCKFEFFKLLITLDRMKITKEMTLNEHLYAIIKGATSYVMSKELLFKLVDLIQQGSYEFFPFICYYIQDYGDYSFLSRLTPSTKYVVSNVWFVFPLLAACSMLNEPANTATNNKEKANMIFTFLVKCSPDEWINILKGFYIIEANNKVEISKLIEPFFIAMKDFILSPGNELAQQMIEKGITVYLTYLFICNASNHLFKEGVDSMDISDVLNIKADKVSNEAMTEKSNPYFKFYLAEKIELKRCLRVELTKNKLQWKDLDHAKRLLSLIESAFSQKYYDIVFLILYFIARYDPDFVRSWISPTRFDTRKIDTKSTCYNLMMIQFHQLKITTCLPPAKFSPLNMSVLDKNLPNEIDFLEIEKSSKKLNEVTENFNKGNTDTNANEEIAKLSEEFDRINEQNSNREEQWKRFWYNATFPGAPWHDESNKTLRFMRDSSLCFGFSPFKLKVNHHFDDHKRASYVRDSGSFREADRKLQEEEEKNSKKEENNMKILTQFSMNCMYSKEIIKKKSIPCVYVKPTKTQNVLLVVSNKALVIQKPQDKMIFLRFVRIIMVLRRNYIGHDNAVEIFMKNGKSYFLYSDKESSEKIISLMSKREMKSVKYFQNAPSRKFFNSLPITKDWVAGKMSNYEYIMHLNIFSERSFNNQSQYPIFPWTFCDFESEKLEFKADKFRDLKLPTGALNDERLQVLKNKENDMIEDGKEPFLYNSYALSPLLVYYYLIRIEPFTSLHIELQGNKFDHAARLFYSLEESFKCCRTLLNDYREVVPEMYFMPEMFVNQNGFDLGVVNDKSISNVRLPKWAADNCPDCPGIEFVYQMRKALESDFVSDKIDEWIDLIWGYKQRGEKAHEALNTYPPIFYEDIWKTVKGDSEEDEGKILEIEASMKHVGQVPKQLFLEKHPKKNVEKKEEVVFTGSIIIEPCDINSATISIVGNKSRIVCSHGEKSLSEVIITNDGRIEKTTTIDIHHSFATLALCNQYIVGATIKSKSIGLIKEVKEQNPDNLYYTTQIVEADGDFFAFVTNSSIIHVYRKKTRRYGIPMYDAVISCIAISEAFQTIVAGTKYGRISFVSLYDGIKTRTVKLPTNGSIYKICITQCWGFVIAFSEEKKDDAFKSKPRFSINIFTINGQFVKKVSYEHCVTHVTTWRSSSGFDYVAIYESDGTGYVFEAFYPERRLNLGFSLTDKNIIAISHTLSDRIIIVTETGLVLFVKVRNDIYLNKYENGESKEKVENKERDENEEENETNMT